MLILVPLNVYAVLEKKLLMEWGALGSFVSVYLNPKDPQGSERALRT